MKEDEARAAVVREAMEWEGTPYRTGARVKGRNGGADCLTSIAGVFANAGLTPHIDIPHYPRDWHLHQEAELYLDGLREWCRDVAPPPERAPEPGDIVMWKFGKCFSHGAIVVAWPIIIHAYCGRPFGRDDAMRTSVLSKIHERREMRGQPRPRLFFTFKDWCA